MQVKKDIGSGDLYIQELDDTLYIDFSPYKANGLIPMIEITDKSDHILLTAYDLDGNVRELVYPLEKAKQRAI